MIVCDHTRLPEGLKLPTPRIESLTSAIFGAARQISDDLARAVVRLLNLRRRDLANGSCLHRSNSTIGTTVHRHLMTCSAGAEGSPGKSSRDVPTRNGSSSATRWPSAAA